MSPGGAAPVTSAAFGAADADLRQRLLSLIEVFSAVTELTALDDRHVSETTVISRAVDLLARHLDFDSCAVYLRRGARMRRIADHAWNRAGHAHARDRPEPATTGKQVTLSIGHPLVRQALEEREPVHCRGCEHLAGCDLAGGRGTTPGACVLVPVPVGRDETGLLIAHHHDADHFQFWDEHAFRLFASVLGHVIGNHRARRRLERIVEAREGQLGDAHSRLQREIEERIQSEESLCDVQATMSSLMSNLPGMAYRRRHDVSWTLMFASEGCRDLTHESCADLVDNATLAFGDLVHPDDRKNAWDAIQCAVHRHEPYRVVYRIVPRGERVKWVEERGRAHYDEAGATVALEGLVIDVTATHEMSRQLAYHSHHDSLTGLANRREFEEQARLALESAIADGSEHALCFMDLDQFKVINDTCGHGAGDELLRQLCRLLRTAIRQGDTLARLGGDEFGLLLMHCTPDGARRVAAGVRHAVQDFRFVWEDNTFSVGLSIGLVPVTRLSESVASVLSRADTACYAAKEAGGNRLHVYDADNLTLVRHHGEMHWVSRINRALEEDRFQLWYQPIVSASEPPATGGGAGAAMPAHFELLVRMIDTDGGIVPPGKFLPAAERYKLASRLDRWVISAAFRWIEANAARLDRLELCSINLSGQTLGDEDFLDFVIDQFDRTGVRAEQICFEVTETAAIANLSFAMSRIQALRQRGCCFALDDFGSGLSSFGYLKKLPVDLLKIDGMFVRDILDDPMDRAMVRSFNEIGQALGKRTIAEFVENEAVLEALRDIGVDYVQGYHLGRPAPLPVPPRAAPPPRLALVTD